MSDARRGPRPLAAIHRLRCAIASLALLALLGGPALPVIEFVLADEAAAFCGRGGRCCCTGGALPAGEGPCLRRGCGCEEPEAASPALGLLRIEVLLPATSVPPGAGPGERAAVWPPARLLSRPHSPPVPPPKPTLSA